MHPNAAIGHNPPKLIIILDVGPAREESEQLLVTLRRLTCPKRQSNQRQVSHSSRR
jgi:hypothetical protein